MPRLFVTALAACCVLAAAALVITGRKHPVHLAQPGDHGQIATLRAG